MFETCLKPFSWAKSKRKLFSDGQSRGLLLARAALKTCQDKMNSNQHYDVSHLQCMMVSQVSYLTLYSQTIMQHLFPRNMNIFLKECSLKRQTLRSLSLLCLIYICNSLFVNMVHQGDVFHFHQLLVNKVSVGHSFPKSLF